jgi:hypothetical protein
MSGVRRKSLPVLSRRRRSNEVNWATTWFTSPVSQQYFDYDAIPDWYSRERDHQLRLLMLHNNYAALAMYNTTAKLSGIHFRIKAKDDNIETSVQDALVYDALWQYSYRLAAERFINDWQGQDNGAFLEILDSREQAGMGSETVRETFGGVRYLDSARVTRTGDETFPVIVAHEDGKQYEMHHTRVIELSQMTSGDSRYYGVGMCALTRCLGVLQTMANVHLMYDEWLGSKPRGQIITGSMPASEMKKAFESDDFLTGGNYLYGRNIYIGTKGISDHDINLKIHTLKNFPDGFSKKDEIDEGMIAIAHAFGFDVREIWQAKERGATRGDSIISDQKMRTKTKRQYEQLIRAHVEAKILPSHLVVEIVGNDAEEAIERAETYKLFAEGAGIQIRNGIMDVRSARVEQMMHNVLTVSEFERLELEDGRLPNGHHVYEAFYTVEGGRYVTVGVDPLDISQHNPSFWDKVDMNIRELFARRATVQDGSRVVMSQVLRALQMLKAEFGQGTYGLAVDAVDPTQQNGRSLPPAGADALDAVS